MAKEDFCENCKFWIRISESEGYCYKYAPQTVVGDGSKDHHVHEHPVTKASDWCGDFVKSQ